MECRFMGAGWSLFQRAGTHLTHSHNLIVQESPGLRVSSRALRRYVASPSTRPTASHHYTTSQEATTPLDDFEPPQAYPLSGYYRDILSMHSTSSHQPTSSRPAPQRSEKPSPATTVEPQSPQDKMAIVFGTRLAGPGRSSRYNPGATPPESTWKTVNGVTIPPRPEEPDNCCMSGCVHCVWDDFRDEMEDWAARLEQAKAKGSSKNKGKETRHGPRSEAASASTSMDDDGGGSEANWPASDEAEDLFASIPVGIREFMKTEKKLKKKHQEDDRV
ncbi:hypothetical protein FE257_002143 [Aspergillus nanangensis]|uniref:Oxidoreductase-like domain-containing protein n=1 Tax=Aspergillus nanangensis TaxID=2582783 RepID=A0AAD4CTE1_ASPNN|nr:hypothetical protein FE257_002143 [Aspergillus nanangensis]